jgi:hypothetical protein
VAGGATCEEFVDDGLLGQAHGVTYSNPNKHISTSIQALFYHPFPRATVPVRTDGALRSGRARALLSGRSDGNGARASTPGAGSNAGHDDDDDDDAGWEGGRSEGDAGGAARAGGGGPLDGVGGSGGSAPHKLQSKGLSPIAPHGVGKAQAARGAVSSHVRGSRITHCVHSGPCHTQAPPPQRLVGPHSPLCPASTGTSSSRSRCGSPRQHSSHHPHDDSGPVAALR